MSAAVERHARLVFYWVLISSSYFFQGANPNANSRFDLARAIAEQHRLQIDDFASNTVDKASSGEHTYSDKAPGVAFVGAAILLVVDPLLDHLPISADTRANSQLFIISFFVLSLLTAFAARLFFLLAIAELGERSVARAFVLTVVLFSATLVFPYSTTLFSHQITADLVFIVYFYSRQGALLGPRAVLAVLFACAYASLIEYPAAPWFAIAYAVLAWPRLRRGKIWVLAPGLAVAALLAAYNAACFGSPLKLGYAQLDATPFAAGMARGFFGIQGPTLSRLYHLLWSGYRGLFFYNPVLVFALLGICYGLCHPKKRRTAALLLGSFAYFVLVNASYAFWQGGACFGPRHLVPVLPLFFTGVLFLPRTWHVSALFNWTALVSFVLMLVGTSVGLLPREATPSPLWDTLIPAFKAGALAVTRFPILAQQTLAQGASREWASFNLGQLLGLPGKASLVPLLLMQSALLLRVVARPVWRELARAVAVLQRGKAPRAIVSLPVYVAGSLVIFVCLAQLYPGLELGSAFSPAPSVVYRPFIDMSDMAVFMLRGEWAPAGTRPYLDVFAEYPIMPVVLFGAIALVAQSLPAFLLVLIGVQALALWRWIVAFRATYWPRLDWPLALLLLLPATLYFGVSRFDLLVAAGIGAFVLCLFSGRPSLAGGCLALLTFGKWVPVLYLPVTIVYLWRSPGLRAQLRQFLIAFALSCAAILAPTLAFVGPQALMAPMRWQLQRAPSEASLLKIIGLAADALGSGGTAHSALAMVLGGLPFLASLVPPLFSPRSRPAFLFSLIFVNNAFAFFSRVSSPQWVLWDTLLWALVFAELTARRQLRAADVAAAVAPNLLAYVYFPTLFDLVRPSSVYFVVFACGLLALRAAYLVFLVQRLRYGFAEAAPRLFSRAS